MTSTLKIDLSKARFEKFKSVFDQLEKALSESDIDFYVLGALARDMLFSTEKIHTRTTADVDIAIYINSKDEDSYQSLRNNLIENNGFTSTKSNNFTLISPDGATIDLLPFGEIEVEDGVEFKGLGLANIKVNGFREVHMKGLQKVVSNDGDTFKVASLSSIILLKLIAFDDRPEMRGNDPGDVASIIANYFDLRSDYIYENHNDLFEEEAGDIKVISAKVIGREMKEVIQENTLLNKRVISILDDHISKADESPFILGMIGDFCKQTDMAVLWIKTILNRIEEDR